jgi:hypothetical protein
MSVWSAVIAAAMKKAIVFTTTLHPIYAPGRSSVCALTHSVPFTWDDYSSSVKNFVARAQWLAENY